ncbi:hypothetical protein [Actinokineospora inagensis]|uniref:hypothetical protein n=1 Tax=Actinokineospora inagensis TaxID=103730 RepID=UPI00040375FE|nr:hypothetical protein [Actinokineospora inagensis]
MRILTTVAAVIACLVGLAGQASATGSLPAPTLITAAKEHAPPGSTFRALTAVFATPTSDPDDVTEWHAAFTTPTGGIQLTYTPAGDYVSTTTWAAPAANSPDDVTMTQWEANDLRLDAGATGDFTELTLAQPAAEPLYTFCLADTHTTVGVGTRSKQVQADLAPC